MKTALVIILLSLTVYFATQTGDGKDFFNILFAFFVVLSVLYLGKLSLSRHDLH